MSTRDICPKCGSMYSLHSLDCGKAPRNNRHNHMTRDIKPLGQCPSCDEYHNRNIPKSNTDEQFEFTTDENGKVTSMGDYTSNDIKEKYIPKDIKNNPIQFWLGQRTLVQNGITSHVEWLIETKPTEGFNHVIEFKAYEAAQAKIAELEKSLESSLARVTKTMNYWNESQAENTKLQEQIVHYEKLKTELLEIGMKQREAVKVLREGLEFYTGMKACQMMADSMRPRQGVSIDNEKWNHVAKEALSKADAILEDK